MEDEKLKIRQDDNGQLAKYNSIDATRDGIRFVHNKGENTMTISVDENVNIENCRISDTTFKEWGLIKEGTEDLDTNVFFEFEDGIQNQFYALNYDDPVALNFSLKIELYGRLELSKENTNKDLIDGSVFNISGNNYNNNVEVKNGKITIDKLQKGTYYVKEVSAPKGYELSDRVAKVEINDKGIFVDDTQITETEDTITFDFENKYAKNNHKRYSKKGNKF